MKIDLCYYFLLYQGIIHCCHHRSNLLAVVFFGLLELLTWREALLPSRSFAHLSKFIKFAATEHVVDCSFVGDLENCVVYLKDYFAC